MNTNETLNMVREDCISCGTIFYFNSNLHQQRKKDKESFYCPNGHSMAYVKGTTEIQKEEIEKLKRELEVAKAVKSKKR